MTTPSTQIIRRNGAQPSVKGPDAWFTGTVWIDPLFPAMEGARASASRVTFEPGARSAWHRHPLGQNLVVVSGVGWTQCEGGRKQEIRAGQVVEWLEKVTNDDYLTPVQSEHAESGKASS